jgi:RNA polymerase sigma-70 factor (ECF subfamily)
MPSSDTAPAPFLTTHWSVVFTARGEASTQAGLALETLCRAYWYPLYAYVRRSGHEVADAQDLTQEFFARLLARDWLRAAGPERGRFRTFLLVALKRFLIGEWRRARVQKRGGGSEWVPLELADAESRYASEPSVSAETIFERRWAMTLLEEAMARLEAEYAAAEKSGEYAELLPWLTVERGAIPYAELAVRLEMSEGAARVAVHRLRKRFRELFREAISHTVSAEEVEAEMRHVARILSARL